MAAAACAAAGAASAAPAMWLVGDRDSQIYLFGSLHALEPGRAWRTPAYDAAFARADAVWFETDISEVSPGQVDALLARYGVDRERRLSQKLTASEVRALGPLLARTRMTVADIDYLRPWAAALMLSMQLAERRGARVDSGADMTVARDARGRAKPVRAFESLEDQVRIFADLPEPAEVAYLADVIHERSPRLRLPRLHAPATLEEAWMAGDLARLAPALVGAMKADNPALYDALLRRRNLAWADALAARMAGAGVDLVNVGALHMVGDEGLPALLAARGFNVRRVQ